MAAPSLAYISIHAPLTGSDRAIFRSMDQQMISIHAPLTGSDRNSSGRLHSHVYFNPRSPYGERHCGLRVLYVAGYFNPRSPYGERQLREARVQIEGHFNPRSPYGERLGHARVRSRRCAISIHAPLTGSDRYGHGYTLLRKNFNPRSPYGERPEISISLTVSSSFQSTLPLRGATARLHKILLRFLFK